MAIRTLVSARTLIIVISFFAGASAVRVANNVAATESDADAHVVDFVPWTLLAPRPLQTLGPHPVIPYVHGRNHVPQLNLSGGTVHRALRTFGAVMSSQDPEYHANLEKKGPMTHDFLASDLSSPMPRMVSLEVSSLIDDWIGSVEVKKWIGSVEVKEKSKLSGEDARDTFSKPSGKPLRQMTSSEFHAWVFPVMHFQTIVAKGAPDHIFALASGKTGSASAAQAIQGIGTDKFIKGSADDIQAIAAVKTYLISGSIRQWRLEQLVRERGFAPDVGEGVKVVDILGIVATPKGRQKGVGRELIHDIVDLAARRGRLVTIMPANDGLRQYYESIGFEDFSESWMVYRLWH